MVRKRRPRQQRQVSQRTRDRFTLLGKWVLGPLLLALVLLALIQTAASASTGVDPSWSTECRDTGGNGHWVYVGNGYLLEGCPGDAGPGGSAVPVNPSSGQEGASLTRSLQAFFLPLLALGIGIAALPYLFRRGFLDFYGTYAPFALYVTVLAVAPESFVLVAKTIAAGFAG